MSLYLHTRNFVWGCMALATLLSGVLLVLLLPFILSLALEGSGFVTLILLVLGLVGMGVACFRVLILPHIKAHKLIKKSKQLLQERDSAVIVGDFHPDVWHREKREWQHHYERSTDESRDAQKEAEKTMNERLSADDILVLTQRDTLRLPLNPLDPALCEKVLQSMVVLVQQGEWRPMSNLVEAIPTIDHVNQKGYTAYYLAFRTCFNFIATYLLDHIYTLYCVKHFRRYEQIKRKEIRFSACRQCKKTSFGAHVTNVVLVLDRGATWKTRYEDGNFRIKYFEMDDLPDFESIEIGDHTPEDIEHFCIQIGNDTDRYRVEQYDRVAYTVLPGISLSPESKARMERFFSMKDPSVSAPDVPVW